MALTIPNAYGIIYLSRKFDRSKQMEDIAEVYYLTTIEQIRAVADPLRLRLVEALTREALTVTQLGERVGESPAKVHYHVRELERISVVRLVETRERGGILEKYYRAVAKSLQMAPDVLRTAPRDEVTGMLNEWFQLIITEALHAVNHHADHPEEDEPLTMSSTSLYATKEEFRALLKDLGGHIKPLEEPRGGDDEQEWMMSIITHRMLPTAAPVPQPPITPIAPPSPIRPISPVRPVTSPASQSATAKTYVVGATDFSRAALERAVAEQRPLEITVIGLCHFANDIPAELVERAVVRFRHWGQLSASPEVREVLRRKGGGA
jgi:DNA-binding transcriptional regulator GbsR (MarR family)